MKNAKYIIFIAFAVAGLGTGLLVAAETQNESQCDQIEQEVIERERLEGTFACFEPGTTDVGLPDSVANASELQCVCRHSQDGIVQYVPIGTA